MWLGKRSLTCRLCLGCKCQFHVTFFLHSSMTSVIASFFCMRTAWNEHRPSLALRCLQMKQLADNDQALHCVCISEVMLWPQQTHYEKLPGGTLALVTATMQAPCGILLLRVIQAYSALPFLSTGYRNAGEPTAGEPVIVSTCRGKPKDRGSFVVKISAVPPGSLAALKVKHGAAEDKPLQSWLKVTAAERCSSSLHKKCNFGSSLSSAASVLLTKQWAVMEHFHSNVIKVYIMNRISCYIWDVWGTQRKVTTFF